MSKIITAEQAANLIQDGATVAATGFGLAAWAEEIAQAIEKRFVETGHPRNITLTHASAIGDWKERGTTRLGKEGLVKRWIGAHIGSSAGMSKLLAEDKIEAYCLPQGVIVQLFREIAAKRPGLITKVGMGTFVDPRVDGAKMNTATTEDMVKVVEFEGEEWLFYKTFPINVALIRGTTVDEYGNLTMENEGVLMEALPLAQAAKNSGGIVIVQAEYLAKAGSLHPKQVRVPGILVDYIVIATKQECCWQTEGLYFNPAFSGDIKVPLNSIPELALDERKIIARRAAMELAPNTIVNLGVGIPSDVAAIAAEENATELLTLTTEAGGIGGVPASLPHFGQAYNAQAIVEHHSQFDYYDGGGIDVAFLGLAQTDKEGNVNVSKFKGRPMGCGGFINITQSSKKVVYCGSFTAGGLEVAGQDGKLVIIKEGKNKKFIERVEQITFSGKYAARVNQPVVYVTERAVFVLENGQVTLTEIAPGIDLEQDVLALMDFKPVISPNLKTMPSEIFQPKWGQLKQIIEANTKG
ncbi:short chain acyl-CoA transferase: fused alpha subunit; beta subunit [uncultured Sporomusa sp.]|uniref:Short chain acyl-CoA transferase: fused alpha subunit beta subunit n=1 Tax=uncultured Sporomusa sp. TaxID=307249 RepID=A0A212LNB7_9FIRM|nr:acyl CoA:acetate/3-ketoacid CoA transferase [uncultured Sporomusa sp.]SCM79000.1 short chain acyl-CoA transferase: fused alpha subunit; beta subunit [uncultured Sporomusa sp.]